MYIIGRCIWKTNCSNRTGFYLGLLLLVKKFDTTSCVFPATMQQPRLKEQCDFCTPLEDIIQVMVRSSTYDL